MKRRIISLLLVAAIFCTFLVPGTKASAADNKGMEIKKTAISNNDGTYTIKLEAYATGDKVISEVKKDIPTDIVLVLDQSGSMSNRIGTVSFEPYQDKEEWWGDDYNTRNQDYYEVRANGDSGNLYYPLSDGSYAAVSVTRRENASYIELESLNNRGYYQYSNNLYEKVGEDYTGVTLTYDYYNGYTYTFSDGTSVTSKRSTDTPNLGNHSPLYRKEVDGTKTEYTYTYYDKDGNLVEIGKSVGETTVFEKTLYKRVVTSSGMTKLEALKNAVETFVTSVSNKALGEDGAVGGGDDVDHRIAIVGFASTSSGRTYENTELLSTQTVVNYGGATSENYRDALVSVNSDGQLNSRLTTAINRLDASGDTYLQYGMDMANKIFEQYPIAEDDTSGRQRVVVVFTDGYPAPSGTNNFNYSMADSAISNALTTKTTYKSTVYTVGVLDDADPTANIESGFTYGGSSSSQQTVASNRYMHYVSSNYLSASSLTSGGALNPKANPFKGGDSYYLAATDAGSLNKIFQQISDQIESGGSTATLGSETVIKDIISPSFALPANATAADITLETYQCTGKTDGAYTWSKNSDAMGAKATVNGDQVSVTGFDFKENYVGTVTEANGSVSYRGNKLVISFTVTPKTGFLGGNDVITNASAGIYENGSAQTPVMTFEQPKVNVPIKNVTVTATDKNVYLKGEVTADQLKDGSEISVGDVTLDLSKATDTDKPYGLDPWQTKYVDIIVTVKDKAGNTISDKLDDLTIDTTYTVEVTVKPKTNGQNASGTPAVAKSCSDGADIYVYKPYIVFQDSSINAGDTPNYATDNFVSTDFAWKHGNDNAHAVMGTAPALTYNYDPVAAPLSAESQVKVSVAMNVTADNPQGDDVTQYVSFYRNRCAAENGCDFQGGAVSATDANRVNFVVHIKTFDLTITKRGTDTIDHDNSTERQSYIFRVTGPNNFSMDIVICGDGSKTIKNLPVGDYTITEEENWSWRYTAQPYTVKADSIKGGSATVTVQNTRDNDKWLNGGAYVSNLFGKLKSGN